MLRQRESQECSQPAKRQRHSYSNEVLLHELMINVLKEIRELRSIQKTMQQTLDQLVLVKSTCSDNYYV